MQKWDPKEDRATLDQPYKRWSAGIFRQVTNSRSPTINKQMHIYVHRLSIWLKWMLLIHYIGLVWLLLLYIVDGPLVMTLEVSGIASVMLASIQLTGYYSGKYSEEIEYLAWRKNAYAMVSAHTGLLLLYWGTINLLMAALIQGLSQLTPAVLIVLFLYPLWGIWKAHTFSVDVKLPKVGKEIENRQCPTWQSRPLN